MVTPSSSADHLAPAPKSASAASSPRQPLSPQTNKSLVDTDPESIVSDYSEMNDLVKEHLANVHIIRKEDLAIANTMPNSELLGQQRLARLEGELDGEYAKRLRKLNFLSLAQEFAELKKSDAKALPYDAHKTPMLVSPQSTSSDASELASDLSDSAATTPGEAPDSCNNLNAQLPDNTKLVGNANQTLNYSFVAQTSQQPSDVSSQTITEASCSDVTSKTSASDDDAHLQDFDVFNMESTMPQLDWAKIEAELEKEERQKLVSERYRTFFSQTIINAKYQYGTCTTCSVSQINVCLSVFTTIANAFFLIPDNNKFSAVFPQKPLLIF